MRTQARCLYAEREGRWFQPLELHVIAGYQRDSFLADSEIADFTVSPGFNPRAGISLANLTSNWALLTLRERSEEHTSELQSLMRISYAVFCLNKNTIIHPYKSIHYNHTHTNEEIDSTE